MHQYGFRKTNGSASQALNAAAQRQMFPFQGLHLGLILGAFLLLQTIDIGPPSVGNPVLNPLPGFSQQSQQSTESLVGSATKDKSDDLTIGTVLSPWQRPTVTTSAAGLFWLHNSTFRPL